MNVPADRNSAANVANRGVTSLGSETSSQNALVIKHGTGSFPVKQKTIV